jgi:hypothetical protein
MYEYVGGMYSDAPETPADRKEQEIETLKRRIALDLANPERTQRRRKALLRLTMGKIAQPM